MLSAKADNILQDLHNRHFHGFFFSTLDMGKLKISVNTTGKIERLNVSKTAKFESDTS